MRCILFSQLFFLIILLDRAVVSQSLTCNATNAVREKACANCSTCSGNKCISYWGKHGSTWSILFQGCSTRNPFVTLPDNRCIPRDELRRICQCNRDNCNSARSPTMRGSLSNLTCHKTFDMPQRGNTCTGNFCYVSSYGQGRLHDQTCETTIPTIIPQQYSYTPIYLQGLRNLHFLSYCWATPDKCKPV